MRDRQFFAATRAPLAVAAALLVAGAAPPAVAHRAASPRTAISDPAQYVNPFVGTKPGGIDYGNGGGAGNTFPGATAPLGMMQWSPDTVTYQHGGYFYDDQRIRGFSLTHISGAGCGDYGNIPFMPFLGDTPVAHETFSHAHESAAPGSYAVTFDNGLRTELTTTQRSGMARFSYPAGQAASLLVDAGRAFNKASGSVTVGTDTISGYTDGGGFCGAGNHYRIYFTAHFDQPFAKAGTVRDGALDASRHTATGQSEGIAPQPPRSAQAQRLRQPTELVHPDAPATGSDAQAMVTFAPGSTVTARVGISFTSAAGAEANLDREQAGAGFDKLRDGVRSNWNDMLARIAVSGGTTQQKRTFYTALYHSLLSPCALSDVDGQYPGMDGQVHQNPDGKVQYADFSGWDVYRSQIQLLALLAPKEASDVAQSVLNQGAQAGYFDRWTLANGGTGVMVGDPLPMIAAEIHAFGGTDFDAADLLSRALDGRGNDKERPGHAVYDNQGFLPVNTPGEWGPAAGTLEYATADFALSQLAERLGDREDHDALLHASANWRNTFNADSKYIQPRTADHTWPSFNPNSGDNFAEGNGAQYTWNVPYNQRGLFDAMGGNASVTNRLDSFFQQLDAGPGAPYAYLGNEPSLFAPWAYDYAGRPDRTDDVVRSAVTTLFGDTPGGEVGNDDLGEMGSWAVWGMIGLFPMVPGRAELVLGSPLFQGITISRGNGAIIDIKARNASADARYVHGLRVGGQASTRPWVSADLVGQGGTLDFDLATTPDPSWGHDPKDAPPSFDVGPARAASGPITGLGGKCLDVDQGAGPTVQLWGCNGTNAQRWTLAGDGTVQAAGKCLDVDGSGTAAGTVVQAWPCNGTGAQQWWPRPDGSLFNPPSGRCLDDPQSRTDDGTRVQLWDCNGTGAQHWVMLNH
ncbi:glycoside hydrolase family 92 protein [Kitasatospora acidiphila]|uniref:Glycoside hydrolase family 92 protein n=1 Tax=Kitasatospora acidiphila TaxID=2567942 RepID=A0A540W677_9ACTN|nr:GH92 family glycosyl hydrolase [Kitasatospora acidiphila]TQF04535.1 glycoside hydrolase family 92 protein [Kitasatospora acidiphila]